MTEEILPNLYRIGIPLPNNPLKELNSYVIKDSDRFLIIDTGMNRDECKSVMFAGLKELHVDLKKTDLFITHLHADHSGNVANLATPDSKVYFNQVEASMVSERSAGNDARWRKIHDFYVVNGFPEKELDVSESNHPGRRYGLKSEVNFTIVKEGSKIEIGDYSFKCLETPGHSPGHVCLYDARKKILISGDHILFDITPNIGFWIELGNPLQHYLDNLERVSALDVDLILPGHRRLLKDHRQRIKELQEHHRVRLSEVITALKEGDKNVYDIAPRIRWDIEYKAWDQFPITQKWFAFGETMSHVRYLEAKGQVFQKQVGKQVVYSLKSH